MNQNLEDLRIPPRFNQRRNRSREIEALWLDYVSELVVEARANPARGATTVGIGIHRSIVGTPDEPSRCGRVLLRIKVANSYVVEIDKIMDTAPHPDRRAIQRYVDLGKVPSPRSPSSTMRDRVPWRGVAGWRDRHVRREAGLIRRLQRAARRWDHRSRARLFPVSCIGCAGRPIRHSVRAGSRRRGG